MAIFKRNRYQHCLLCFVLFIQLSGVFCFSELSFITEPSDVVVITRDPVILDCVAHGQPPITIRWLRNGVRVTESTRLQILANGSLYIPEVRRDGPESDKGFYQCLSQNRYGAILSQRSRLTITNISPFVVHPVLLEVTEGSVARFTCQVTSNPPASVTWELDQSTLPLETDRITVLPNGVLQIHNVQLEDAGKYRCVATNIGNRVKSSEATLSVIEPGVGPKPRQRPQIIAGPQNVTVSLHHTVVLECIATGNPRPIISWSRVDSKPIDVYNARVLGSGNLLISNVKPQHNGVYLCRATTPGTRNYTIAAANLTVLEPPSMVERPESQTRPRAGTARFMCQAQGVPPPRITWLKNGEEVHLNGRIKMYNSKLVITQITPEDDAIYQCVAENDQGSVLSLARLIVVMSEDRPSAPRNIHAETISSSAILLAWERPIYNADKVIAYSVHYMKAEGLNNEEYQAVIGNDTTSYIIDDLEPAWNYSFYIVAYMPMGASRMSDQVCQHTLEDVPLRSPELSLTSYSPTDIQVSWQPLSTKLSRGNIWAYRLSYRTAADATVLSVELAQNNTQYLLGDLQPDTIYLLRIAAATRVGWCKPSSWTSHRTPKTSSNKVPPAPLLQQLEPLNCTSILVRWQPSPGSVVVQGYRLCYHEEGQPEQPSIQLQPEDTEYTISGLDPRRKYHVKLLALSLVGDGYQADQTLSTPGCVSVRDHPVASPPAPDHVSAVANSSSAVYLRWSRPAFASRNVVSYTARCTPVGLMNASAVRYIQTTNQSVQIQSLDSNTRYEFVVRLHVDQLASPWSMVVFQRTLPAAPSHPPEGVRVSLIEDGTALVSWREPAENNLAVTHYTILYASQRAWLAGYWQTLQREGSNTMALLELLEPGNVYLVKISASNQVGDGPFSTTVELALGPGSRHRGKSPRHSGSGSSSSDTTVFSDDLYHTEQNSMTGIIVGVCIALACIVMCTIILISKGRSRKSSICKIIDIVNGEGTHGPHTGLALANEHQAENIEALMPMMAPHFIDAEGGTNLVITEAGPVCGINRSKRWQFFKTERDNRNTSQAENRACLYEAGKTVLCYEEKEGAPPLQPSSLHILFGPLGGLQSSGGFSEGNSSGTTETSDGSQETGDSGHYSNEEISNEMSNPSTATSGRNSRPPSFGSALDDSPTPEKVEEEKLILLPGFKVESEVTPPRRLYRHHHGLHQPGHDTVQHPSRPCSLSAEEADYPAEATVQHPSRPCSLSAKEAAYPAQATVQHPSRPCSLSAEEAAYPGQATVQHPSCPCSLSAEEAAYPAQATVQHPSRPCSLSAEEAAYPAQATVQHPSHPCSLSAEEAAYPAQALVQSAGPSW
ncbi:protogenin B-like [Salvelinus alpinus]|uniref:protogenin B-like n=1 Tax=Salvelinus alpinus TaxID=8036 RepID=UPI0039FD9244